MRLITVLGRLGLGVGVAAAMYGATTVAAKPPAGGGGGCTCATYYAPVTCSNGRTYSNQCFADCAGATGCVPSGPGPFPVP